MPSLPESLFNEVERAALRARAAAEKAAAAVLEVLAVGHKTPHATLALADRSLRNALRARARQLGNGLLEDGLPRLLEEIAYVQWHRMLFARFLAENGLLLHPEWQVPVTLAECAELAAEAGEPDAWTLAARFAATLLPGIFRADDPAAQATLAPEDAHALQAILDSLPAIVFTSDDALGWMYQFWQSSRKKEVNASGRKIGGADLAPVTQLFTEDYMVRFLLENSLGAWWAARHPDSPLLQDWPYLRFLNTSPDSPSCHSERREESPAAGTFPGWPAHAAEVTVLDPCCGSGHFLVAAFDMLRRMRMEEEGLSAAAAGDAVLRDNLFGLELDPRCTQIAAFALALAAWKAGGGYRPLPALNVACSGLPVTGQLDDWLALANGAPDLRAALEQLHALFKDAPDLGSLIDPRAVGGQGTLFAVDYARVAPLLEKALKKERAADPAAAVFGASAAGVLQAARLLAGRYTLVATNVPYLGFKKQDSTLKEFCASWYGNAKMDLATVFVERCRNFTIPNGTYALVTPQNWLSLGSYRRLRKNLLLEQIWRYVIWLGPGAFRTISGEVVKPILIILDNYPLLDTQSEVLGLDISDVEFCEKAASLRHLPLERVEQSLQLKNPDARIVLKDVSKIALLKKYAFSPRGIVTGDGARWIRCFWEIPVVDQGWRFLQSTVKAVLSFGGREHIVDWSLEGKGMLRPGLANPAYGRRGVSVSQMSNLPCTLYTGELYDNNSGAIVPYKAEHVAAIWAFCSSSEFVIAVRRIDKKLSVTNDTLVKVPFDLAHWQAVAEAAGPLPEPHSDDPTQWLFNGCPAGAADPLQVAVARLLGYRWPQQPAADALDALADRDGIVCLPSVAGQRPAVDRLRALLAAAYGADWSPAREAELLAGVGYAGRSLEDWLRDGFFIQHCQRFHNRPFIWHLWDGRKDGFAALVNYHKLDRPRLQSLLYTYLNPWLVEQRKQQAAGEPGAEGRALAAQALHTKLAAIEAGEPPYDIYIRWKPLAEQPLGWQPDLNDGVRLNIRPFVAAGILRSKFTIHWKKDRGLNPDGSERLNDRHHTLSEKQAAGSNS